MSAASNTRNAWLAAAATAAALVATGWGAQAASSAKVSTAARAAPGPSVSSLMVRSTAVRHAGSVRVTVRVYDARARPRRAVEVRVADSAGAGPRSCGLTNARGRAACSSASPRPRIYVRVRGGLLPIHTRHHATR